MKKLILYLVCFLAVFPSFAQIKLEENKSLPSGPIKGEIQNIANVGKYYANVVAYAMVCKFSDTDNKVIFDSYFNKLSKFNLSQTDKDYLLKDYEKEFKITMERNKGKNEKDLSCSQFKTQYDKILEFVKK